jgi:hypothetical protein
MIGVLNTSVLCEIILVGVCIFSILSIQRTHKRVRGVIARESWLLGFSSLGMASLFGALNYSGLYYTPGIPTTTYTIPQLHSLFTEIASFFGAMNLVIAAYSSIDQPPRIFSKSSIQYFALGLIAGLQVWMLFEVRRTPLQYAIVKFVPLVSMIVLLIQAIAGVLFRKTSGVKRSRCLWLILGIVVFALADNSRIHGASLVLPPIVLATVDVYHLLLSLAVFCFANVAHPLYL